MYFKKKKKKGKSGRKSNFCEKKTGKPGIFGQKKFFDKNGPYTNYYANTAVLLYGCYVPGPRQGKQVRRG